MVVKQKPDLKLRKQFGEKVRVMRKKLGLSQEELGFKANIHRTYIGAVERGEQNISLDNIGRLAKYLGINVKDLLDF